ncbi:MAG TPA: hypothetical protein VHW70_04885, partial [Edaphobacter sp.]|nr:hypothetical protein [Edaphobacter sp.]
PKSTVALLLEKMLQDDQDRKHQAPAKPAATNQTAAEPTILPALHAAAAEPPHNPCIIHSLAVPLSPVCRAATH